MKKFITLSVILLILASFSYAKVWQVDSNPGNGAADFTTAQAAHDGATDGDTLYFSGSAVEYGNLTTTKELYIFGSGYFLTENDSTQAYKASSTIGVITFQSGSENSVLSGLKISACDIDVDYITITRCHVYQRTSANWAIHLRNGADYIQITQNHITPSGNGIGIGEQNSNIVISNNYITHFNTTCIQGATSNANIMLQNNILTGRIYIYNAVISNNIIRPARNTGYWGNTNNEINNNICHAEQFDTTGNNQQNVDMDAVFVGEGSTDGQWQILEGGAADGTGTFGNDIGMFGGHDPYILSGLPNIPAIYEFESTGSESQALPIRVKIKSRH